MNDAMPVLEHIPLDHDSSHSNNQSRECIKDAFTLREQISLAHDSSVENKQGRESAETDNELHGNNEENSTGYSKFSYTLV